MWRNAPACSSPSPRLLFGAVWAPVLCVASYFLSIVFAPSSTCSTVQWRTLNLIMGTPLSPSPPSLPGTDPSEGQSGCIPPPISDTRQGPPLRHRPQLWHRQRSVIIKWRMASYQVWKVGDRWRGHLADDLGEVGKSVGTARWVVMDDVAVSVAANHNLRNQG